MKQVKIAIAGSGTIGTTVAYSLLSGCSDCEILLADRNRQKAWAKAFDISHCTPELENRHIHATTIEECCNADVVLVTAGTLPKENGTRADVLQSNIAIFGQLIPILAQNNPGAVFIVITNPVDAMAYVTRVLSKLPVKRVIGTGTELDSMRLRSFTAERYKLNPAKLAIPVIGEHGDTMVPVWSRASYNGNPFSEAVRDFTVTAASELLEQTKRAGWNIRQAGEHSCYGISFSATRIINAVLGRSAPYVQVSAPLQGEYGISGTYISLPSELDTGGIKRRFMPELDNEETRLLEQSVQTVKKQMEAADSFL